MEFGKEYKINGAYKNYTDAFFSWVGNGMQPYILLLSDDGMVSYVDVWTGFSAGYICAVEPMMGLVELESFEAPSEMVTGVTAKTKSGQEVSVDEVLYVATTDLTA